MEKKWEYNETVLFIYLFTFYRSIQFPAGMDKKISHTLQIHDDYSTSAIPGFQESL
jgi:hypothetical protein